MQKLVTCLSLYGSLSRPGLRKSSRSHRGRVAFSSSVARAVAPHGRDRGWRPNKLGLCGAIPHGSECLIFSLCGCLIDPTPV